MNVCVLFMTAHLHVIYTFKSTNYMYCTFDDGIMKATCSTLPFPKQTRNFVTMITHTGFSQPKANRMLQCSPEHKAPYDYRIFTLSLFVSPRPGFLSWTTTEWKFRTVCYKSCGPGRELVYVPSASTQKLDCSGQQVGVVKMVIWGAWLVQSQAFMRNPCQWVKLKGLLNCSGQHWSGLVSTCPFIGYSHAQSNS